MAIPPWMMQGLAQSSESHQVSHTHTTTRGWVYPKSVDEAGQQTPSQSGVRDVGGRQDAHRQQREWRDDISIAQLASMSRKGIGCISC